MLIVIGYTQRLWLATSNYLVYIHHLSVNSTWDTDSDIAWDTDSDIAWDTDSDIAWDTDSDIARDTDRDIAWNTDSDVARNTDSGSCTVIHFGYTRSSI